MTSILTNTADITQKWAKGKLKSIIKPHMKVVILAMSDFDNVKNQEDWIRDYGVNGTWFAAYEGPLRSYGITDIVWLSPFRDDRLKMINELSKADLIVLPGGAPDLFMKNIKKFGLKKTLKAHTGIYFGISAGAMILMDDYHISPDEDYDEFSWHKGLGFYDFDLEPHFTGRKSQRDWMEKALAEKNLKTYAVYEDGGLLVEDGKVTLLGKVEEHGNEQ